MSDLELVDFAEEINDEAPHFAYILLRTIRRTIEFKQPLDDWLVRFQVDCATSEQLLRDAKHLAELGLVRVVTIGADPQDRRTYVKATGELLEAMRNEAGEL